MHLFKTDLLMKDLLDNKLSQGEIFSYFLLYTVLLGGGSAASGIWFPVIGAEYLQKSNAFVGIILSSLMVAGFVFCFQLNKKIDDRLFLERFICLSVPITIKATILCVILSLVTSVMEGSLKHNLFFIGKFNLRDILLSLYILGYYNLNLYKSFKGMADYKIAK